MSKLIMLRIMDTTTDTCSNSQSSTMGAINSETSASESHMQKSDIAWNHHSKGVNKEERF